MPKYVIERELEGAGQLSSSDLKRDFPKILRCA